MKSKISSIMLSIICCFACSSNKQYDSPIFTEDDFSLCSIPLPEGYPQSWTHAGIAFSEKAYHGYHYFLTTSPYPSGDDDWENPMFHYANGEGKEPPTLFIPYPGNPLQDDPGDGYNADPDIFFVDTTLYVINRVFLRPNLFEVNAQRCIPTQEGFCFSSPVVLYDNKQTPKNFTFHPSLKSSLISPSFVPYERTIRSYHLATNSYNDGTDCQGVVIMEGESLDDEYSFHFYKVTQFENVQGKPWHMDVFPYKDKLYAIVCSVIEWTPNIRKNALYLAVSDDWEKFRFYSQPLSTINSYRSSACVRNDGELVLYISTLGYHPQGDCSVDGRNIMVAHKWFPYLLQQIEE